MKNIKEFDQFLNEAAPAGAVTDPIDQLKKDFAGKPFTTGKYDGGSSINWGKGKMINLFVFQLNSFIRWDCILDKSKPTFANFSKKMAL